MSLRSPAAQGILQPSHQKPRSPRVTVTGAVAMPAELPRAPSTGRAMGLSQEGTRTSSGNSGGQDVAGLRTKRLGPG